MPAVSSFFLDLLSSLHIMFKSKNGIRKKVERLVLLRREGGENFPVADVWNEVSLLANEGIAGTLLDLTSGKIFVHPIVFKHRKPL